jgi:hypothetical protein
MGGDSKKQKPLDKIKARYFNWWNQRTEVELEKIVKLVPDDVFGPHLLSDKVAQNPLQDDEPKLLLLNFIYYKSDICFFDAADGSRMKSLLDKFVRVCQFTSQQFFTCDLNPRPVNCSGDYAPLFNHLDDDVEKIYEIDISGYSRFYGFVDESYFYIVAVDTKHKNTH